MFSKGSHISVYQINLHIKQLRAGYSSIYREHGALLRILCYHPQDEGKHDSLALLTPAWPWRVAAGEDLDWWEPVVSTSVHLSCLLGPQESCAVIGSSIYFFRLRLQINHCLIFLQKYLCWLNRATPSRQNLLLLLLSKGSVGERPMAVILSLNGALVPGLFVFPLNENSGFKALR